MVAPSLVIVTSPSESTSILSIPLGPKLDFKISAIIFGGSNIVLLSILFLCFGSSLFQEQDWNLGLLLWVRHLIVISPTAYLTDPSYYLLSIYLLQVELWEGELANGDVFKL